MDFMRTSERTRKSDRSSLEGSDEFLRSSLSFEKMSSFVNIAILVVESKLCQKLCKKFFSCFLC